MEARHRRSSLYDFLHKKCVVQKGNEFTHTNIYGPTASYYITPDHTPKFYELYKAALKSGEDLHLTEKHRDIGPVVIDLDFRFNPTEEDEGEGDPKRRYTHDVVKTIVECYSRKLAEYLCDTVDFNVYVLEKPKPVMHKGLLKDGIHIMIPGIVTRPMFQSMLREMLLDAIGEILEPLDLVNTIKDVVDEAVIERNNWQMYGSKKPHSDKYRVTTVFKYTIGEGLSTIEGLEADEDYVELLSIRNKYEETEIKFERQEDLKKYEDLVEQRKMQVHFKKSVFTRVKNMKQNCNDEDYHLALCLVDLLKPDRANSYNDWIRVGWCLRNIDYRLLHKWVEFSKKSPKYQEGECDTNWDYMRQDGVCLKMGTLHMWAKQDDPERYHKIIQEDIRNLVKQAASGLDYDIARVIKRMFAYQFMYDVSNKLWYQFENHRWSLTTDGIALMKLLPTVVADTFRHYAGQFQSAAAIVDNQEEKDRLDALVGNLNAVIKKLKKVSIQRNVLSSCAMLFDEKKVDEKLDSNTHLIGFENGVYDLDSLEFREGRPEDYISISTRINYQPYDADNPVIGELLRFMTQILPSEGVRNYVLRLFTSFLHGNIREERFHVWTGSGCHKIDAPIMMADGTIKKVQDVQVGDQLMGDDSTPRNVLTLCRGYQDMYEIVPSKGEPFIVNGDHILSLKATQMISMKRRGDKWVVSWNEHDTHCILRNHKKKFAIEGHATMFKAKLYENPKVCKKGDVIDVSVNKYLKNVKRLGRRNMCIYSVGVDYPKANVPIDPYMQGYMLGDVNGSNNIPHVYKINDRDTRLQLLAGIIDRSMTDNGKHHHHKNRYDVILSDEDLMDDVVFLARSLGFACYSKNNVTAHIVGNNLNEVPTKIPMGPMKESKDVLVRSFKVRQVEAGNFYGFELDGNHRYLMGDFTVTHNSNGKSKCLELYEKSFGEYCCTLPIALLTQKRGASNSASPELARAKSKRFACLQEPGENERLNIGLMKEMTGGDKLYCRGLYKEGSEFKPQFKMILTCNHLPNVPSDDGGTWRRIRVVRFESRFCDNPDPKKPNEHPIDQDLSSKFDEWKEPFMSLLIENWKRNINTKITEPDEVLECTRDYQRRNDIIADFLDNCIESFETGFLTIADAFVEFKSWLKEEGVIDRSMRKSDFQSYVEKQYGKCVKRKLIKGWNGFRLKSSVAEHAADDYE